MAVNKEQLKRYNAHYDRKRLHTLSRAMNRKLGDYASIIAIEELSELMQATTKYLRFDEDFVKDKGFAEQNRMNMIEELADATIALDIIKTMAGVSQDDINQMIAYKIDKRFKYLDEGKCIKKKK